MQLLKQPVKISMIKNPVTVV